MYFRVVFGMLDALQSEWRALVNQQKFEMEVLVQYSCGICQRLSRSTGDAMLSDKGCVFLNRAGRAVSCDSRFYLFPPCELAEETERLVKFRDRYGLLGPYVIPELPLDDEGTRTADASSIYAKVWPSRHLLVAL